MTLKNNYSGQIVKEMIKQKPIIFSILSGLCLISILLLCIFYLRQTVFSLKGNPSLRKKNVFKNIEGGFEGNTPIIAKNKISKRKKPLENSISEEHVQNNTLSNTSSVVANKNSDQLFEKFLRDETFLQATGLAKDSAKFLQDKDKFYNKATREQKSEGTKLLNKLRSTMGMPPNLQFRAIYTKDEQKDPSYMCNCLFKSPQHYREEANGEFSYQYVTDGTFEISNYAEDMVQRLVGIVPCDLESNVFLERFPTRIMSDSDLVWQARKVIHSGNDKDIEVDVIGNWLYDVYMDTGDNLIHQLIFYDRNNRSNEIVRICNINYQRFEVNDPKNEIKVKYVWPTSYKIIYNDKAQTQTYNVSLEYTDFEGEIPQHTFDLKLNPLQ